MKSAKREGFSLIEMIIAIAIVGIVMSGVILLISYGTNSMRRTSIQVNLQNQAKDAMTHITTHLQEAADAKFYENDAGKHMIVAVKGKDFVNCVPTKLNVCYYWSGDYDGENVVYYANWDYPKDWGWGRDTIDPANDDDKVYFDEKGDIKYDVFLEAMNAQFDSWNDAQIFGADTLEAKRPFILCKDVGKFIKGSDDSVSSTSDPSASPEPTPTDPAVTPTGAPGPTPTSSSNPVASPDPSAVPVVVSGKSVTFTLLLENSNKDTRFKTTKTVYLRNQ